MADIKVIADRADIVAIADAIRAKTSSTEGMTIAEMPTQIGGISGGVALPTLTSPASEDEIFLNKQTIDEDGNVLTGTFTIDSELATQDNLIAQIQAAVDELPEADSSSGSSAIKTCIVTVETDEGSSKLGVRMVDGLPVPIYQEESWESMTWEAPCGSIVAVAYSVSDNNICVNATYLGHDNGTYAPSLCMGYLQPVHLFRIDANAGEEVTIQMYEFEPF